MRGRIKYGGEEYGNQVPGSAGTETARRDTDMVTGQVDWISAREKRSGGEENREWSPGEMVTKDACRVVNRGRANTQPSGALRWMKRTKKKRKQDV